MTTFTKSDIITLLTALPSGPSVRATSDALSGDRRVARIVTGTADATTVVYRMLRITPNYSIKRLQIALDGNGGALPTITTFTISVGLYYSDGNLSNGGDGTNPANAGNTTPISDSFFALTYDAHALAADTYTDITFQNAGANPASIVDGFYTPPASQYRLWDAVQNGGVGRVSIAGFNTFTQGQGYSSGASALWTTLANSGPLVPGNPGGMVDICIRNTTTLSASAGFGVSLIATVVS